MDHESFELLTMLTHFISGKQRWVIIGDFNAPRIDWQLSLNVSPGVFDICLLDWVKIHAAHQHIKEPTRFRDGFVRSLLDLLITPFISDVASLEVSPSIGKSDHVAIFTKISLTAPQPSSTFIRRYAHTNVHEVF